ncbi:hypothetical protein JAAARDRAFT_31991 [Jaapia argillacea MUCL 33604]|uniref:Autophagy-related protein 2 n=1 Tax=Jaapia argillacea MUCL 33604 TaxID=933084 RepID=A0A067QBX7_9AGAM|nr:hypothetical protein JAAARDRAFT_31991 [Jaapia argillacea MUCL 33604]
MTSWISSWIPSLPTVDFSYALPSSIQTRFLSFVLKRSLGHLLKPGQLDINQIDSQIGSGYVQVKDLQLDEDAINTTLDTLSLGLPIHLHKGTISSVTARVPWPNPLTSTIGLSLSSVHLIFHILPSPSPTPTSKPRPANPLAESVASVAETFIHEELTPREEATLRGSFHPDLAGSTSSYTTSASAFESSSFGGNIPGGFDVSPNPFTSPDDDEPPQTHHGDGFHGEGDPEGVGIFASLIERLLARFEFDASDVKITIIDEGNASFTLWVPKVEYGTEPNGGVAGSPQVGRDGVQMVGGDKRTVRIEGVKVTSRCLRPRPLPPPQPLVVASEQVSTPASLSPISTHAASSLHSSQLHIAESTTHNATIGSPPREPSSPTHSDSSIEMDEETQMMMSQSIVSLPPRPRPPSAPASEPASDDDEGEGEMPAFMTQSLASLPPRPTSPPSPHRSYSPPPNFEYLEEESPKHLSHSPNLHELDDMSASQESETPLSRSLATIPPPSSPPPRAASPTSSVSSSVYHAAPVSPTTSTGSRSTYYRSASPTSSVGLSVYHQPGSSVGSPRSGVAEMRRDGDRPPSPSLSVGSSMYQSAFSGRGGVIRRRSEEEDEDEDDEDEADEENDVLYGEESGYRDGGGGGSRSPTPSIGIDNSPSVAGIGSPRGIAYDAILAGRSPHSGAGDLDVGDIPDMSPLSQRSELVEVEVSGDGDLVGAVEMAGQHAVVEEVDSADVARIGGVPHASQPGGPPAVQNTIGPTEMASQQVQQLPVTEQHKSLPIPEPFVEVPEVEESIVATETSDLPPQHGLQETEKPEEVEEVDEDEVMLSFGSEPIVITLTTPPVKSLPSSPPPPVAPPSHRHSVTTARSRPSVDAKSREQVQEKSKQGQDLLKLEVSMGIIVCAFGGRHVNSLLAITSRLPPSKQVPAAPSESNGGLADQVEAKVSVKGVVVTVFLSKNSGRDYQKRLDDLFAHPLIPPILPGGYVRLHLDTLSLSLYPTPTVSPTALPHPRQTHPLKSIPSKSPKEGKFSMSELSLFAFFQDSGEGSGLRAYPILISDPNLPFQYLTPHVHPHPSSHGEQVSPVPSLPVFEVVDWTDSTHSSRSAKVSIWRTKAPPASHGGSNVRRSTDVRNVMSSSPGRKAFTPEFGLAPFPGKPPSPNVDTRSSPFISATIKLSTDGNVEVSAQVVPIHVFLDLGLLSGGSDKSGSLLDFLEDAFTLPIPAAIPKEGHTSDHRVDEDSRWQEEEGEEGSDGGDTPPATPRHMTVRERERVQERQRLERLVLEDLELDVDYGNQGYRDKSPKHRGLPQQTSAKATHTPKRQKKPLPEASSKVCTKVSLSAVRLEIRCPPLHPQWRRSGSLVVDCHDLSLVFGAVPAPSQSASNQRPRFVETATSAPVTPSSGTKGNELAYIEWRRMIVAYAGVGQAQAIAIVSLGDLGGSAVDRLGSESAFVLGGTSPPTAPSHGIVQCPNIRVAHTSLPTRHPSSKIPTLVISASIPSVYVNLSKPVLDGMQLWADDISQFFDRLSNCGETDTEKAGSRDASLIGSRYFARQGSSGASSRTSAGVLGGKAVQNPERSTGGEVVVKLNLSEAFIRLNLPRAYENRDIRPFDLSASDVDVLMEVKPEGKDETVITLAVMNVDINDITSTGQATSLLALASPRTLLGVRRPMVKLRFTSLVVPETTAKESKIKLSLHGFLFNASPQLQWAEDLATFAKAPPGAFESVIPSERTRLSVRIHDSSIRAFAPPYPGALVLFLGEIDFTTDLVGASKDFSFHLSVPSLSILLVDDISSAISHDNAKNETFSSGVIYWKRAGYALLTEISDLDLAFEQSATPLPSITAVVNKMGLQVHLCADSISALTEFIGSLTASSKDPEEPPSAPKSRRPTRVSTSDSGNAQNLMSSVDEHAFRRLPEVGSAADMINDDLPTNLDYLDASFGAAAGFRELTDEDLDEFDVKDVPETPSSVTGIISNVGGETIRMLHHEGINIVENFYDTLPPDLETNSRTGDTTLRVRAHDCDVVLLLYDGYDWARTRKTIEEEIKAMKRRLAKIRQLLASGQNYDPNVQETSALLFNSVYIGLEQDVDELEPGAIIAAIDEELREDAETATQSSWQSLKPHAAAKSPPRSSRGHRKRLTRSKGPSIEIKLMGLSSEVDQYRPGEPMASRVFATVRDLEILDHIKTSTWRKFLSELLSDSRGNVRETESNMVRVELLMVHPVAGNASEEARLRAKILPLRLNVDQDALDFLKKFFSFKDPHVTPSQTEPTDEIYFQHAEVFPVDLKLDYKPRRVDYRALREGKTIELMNFFHFDGSEMTLRHLTLHGITGWPRFFDLLNDLWTPDVKATQMVDVISGVAPIRSVVNVGSGVADLVLIPIAQYKKDGRVIRGMQKGTTAFMQTTAMEMIKLGARLATGTQVILEQAETVLGGQFKEPMTIEALQLPAGADLSESGLASEEDDETRDLISKYAEQPGDVKEGIQFAYKSLRKNLNSAAQTILAVPMEVYERSGDEGAVRAVIRAVPIAVLKPMIGASEAVSKTLFGLQNSLDPKARYETEAKYKQR